MENAAMALEQQGPVMLRAEILFQQQRHRIIVRTDRLFAGLMVFQYLAGIVMALVISPRTWAGIMSQTHIHVYAAVFLGGLICGFPLFLSLRYPGSKFTRLAIAIAQMLVSVLLIHLTGGRIETHFHVFGSLAFLAFYRDWQVILTATVVVALDHALRGIFWPQSVYGIMVVQPWRFLEHAGWVIFEDVFLLNSIHQGLKDMKKLAARQAELEDAKCIVEGKVIQRTEELAETQKKLSQSEKLSAIGQLAAGVAHEINNPLGVILGFAQSLAGRIPSGDILELPVKSIVREATRCKNLVQDLLVFSRNTRAEAGPLDINQAVEGALSLVLAQAKLKKVEVKKVLAQELPRILGSPNQIQQVIINLASNAMDAMPQGGRLTITTEFLESSPLSWVCLNVSDTGSGIPADVLPKIFDPFFTTKAQGKGTGLGLSLVYDIVTKHSGAIDVKSQPGGTEFCVKFPAKAGQELQQQKMAA